MAGSGNLCLQSSAKSKKNKTKNFKNIQVPMLGLGCMRFPMKGSEVDLYEVEKWLIIAWNMVQIILILPICMLTACQNQ